MAHVILKSHHLTDTSIVPALSHISLVVDPTCSLKYKEYMVSTWVNIEDYRDIVDAIVDKELKNIDNVSSMDIDVYGD